MHSCFFLFLSLAVFLCIITPSKKCISRLSNFPLLLILPFLCVNSNNKQAAKKNYRVLFWCAIASRRNCVRFTLLLMLKFYKNSIYLTPLSRTIRRGKNNSNNNNYIYQATPYTLTYGAQGLNFVFFFLHLHEK